MRHEIFPSSEKPSRARALALLLAAAAVVWFVGELWQVNTHAQAQAQAQQSNFVGGTPSAVDAKAVRTTRLRFPAGSRSNWHTHSWGQLLMVEEGKALTQERGAQVREMLPGQPWFTKAGVEHWHGASPDGDMLQLTIYEGDVKWLEPVTDAQYKAAPRK